MIDVALILQVGPLKPSLTEALRSEFQAEKLPDDPRERTAWLAANAERVGVAVTAYNVGVGTDLMAALPNLRAVLIFGVGYDSTDTAQARERGIAVATTPGVLTDAVDGVPYRYAASPVALAALGPDVLADEPQVPAELLTLDSVVLQPHVASTTELPRQRRADHASVLMRTRSGLGTLVVATTALTMAACAGFTDVEPISELSPSPLTTTTPPGGAGLVPAQPTAAVDPCAGLAGGIELQLLVGPSEAVGMLPVAVGTVPFTVLEDEGIFVLSGDGPVRIEDQVYEAEWGTYTVTFDSLNKVTGTCHSAGVGAELAMTIVMDGEQLVSIRADGIQADYPWEGTRTLDVTLPAEDGATTSGEGWMIVLHLDG